MRRFNRNYTQRVGALDASFLGLGMPLGAARLVYEIGTAATTVQALRARLGLDSGYLSRMLRGLAKQGYVAVRPDPADRRRRLVELTVAGQKLWDDLEGRSEERAHLLLDPLTERQRNRLNEALATADLLVRAASVTIDSVDPSDALAREAMERYVAEMDERFEDGFDPGPIDAEDEASLRPPDGLFVVAVSDGEPVAGGGVRSYTGGGETTAEIKRMWVHPDWRGAGLGSRLLRHLERESAFLGHPVVRLDTRHVLGEAIAMYERAGYEPIERYNDNPYATHFFRKELPVPGGADDMP